MASAAPQRALVVGPGAIGSIVAARLARAGVEVTVACRSAATADLLSRTGVVAIDPHGVETTAKVRAVTVPEELVAAPEVAFVATKCADAAQALRTWVPHLAPTVPVVALQNGLMGDALAPLAAGRYVETVVHFPATLERAARSVQTGPGGFDVGAWPTKQGPSATAAHLERAAAALRLVGPVEVQGNMVGAKWTKLIINSCITTLGVVTGQTLGELLGARRARDVFLAVADEGYRAGTAAAVRFETVQRFHPRRFAQNGGGAARRWMLHGILRLLARKYRRHRSSSLQSLERGAKTEVAFLNGVIVATGAHLGVPTPVNAALVAAVQAIEAGTRRPAPALLDEIPIGR